MQIKIGRKTYTGITLVAETSGYDREYLRKLCKSGRVDCVQQERGWFLHEPSLAKYQNEDSHRHPHQTKSEPTPS